MCASRTNTLITNNSSYKVSIETKTRDNKNNNTCYLNKKANISIPHEIITIIFCAFDDDGDIIKRYGLQYNAIDEFSLHDHYLQYCVSSRLNGEISTEKWRNLPKQNITITNLTSYKVSVEVNFYNKIVPTEYLNKNGIKKFESDDMKSLKLVVFDQYENKIKNHQFEITSKGSYNYNLNDGSITCTREKFGKNELIKKFDWESTLMTRREKALLKIRETMEQNQKIN